MLYGYISYANSGALAGAVLGLHQLGNVFAAQPADGYYSSERTMIYSEFQDVSLQTAMTGVASLISLGYLVGAVIDAAANFRVNRTKQARAINAAVGSGAAAAWVSSIAMPLALAQQRMLEVYLARHDGTNLITKRTEPPHDMRIPEIIHKLDVIQSMPCIMLAGALLGGAVTYAAQPSAPIRQLSPWDKVPSAHALALIMLTVLLIKDNINSSARQQLGLAFVPPQVAASTMVSNRAIFMTLTYLVGTLIDLQKKTKLKTRADKMNEAMLSGSFKGAMLLTLVPDGLASLAYWLDGNPGEYCLFLTNSRLITVPNIGVNIIAMGLGVITCTILDALDQTAANLLNEGPALPLHQYDRHGAQPDSDDDHGLVMRSTAYATARLAD